MSAVALRSALSRTDCAPGCSCRRNRNPVHCPGPRHKHGDLQPSLTVNEGDNGAVLFHCQAGCTQDEVLHELKARGLWQTEPTDFLKATEKLTAIYQYKDTSGTIVAEKGRWDRPDGSKRFNFRHVGEEWPKGDSGIKTSALPLLGSEKLAERPNDIVFLTEGEKDRQACEDAGLLAVCAAGSASQRDFGTALAVLRDRDVVLWADNDRVGVELMQHVARLLAGIVHSATIIKPDSLGPREGATEWFALGHTVDELTAYEPPKRVDARWDGPADIIAVIRLPDRRVEFTFGEVERSGKAVETQLTVRPLAMGYEFEPWVQRINLESNSARTDLVRSLKAAFPSPRGEDLWQWDQTLNSGVNAALALYRDQSHALKAADLPRVSRMEYLVAGMVPLGAPTILYGDGESTKSLTALWLGLCVANGWDFLDKPVQRRGVLYMDWEDDEETFAWRMDRLLLGRTGEARRPDNLYYWRERSSSLADRIGAVKRLIAETGVGLLIVDAANSAAGVALEDSTGPARFFNALDRLEGLTTLVISHSPKDNDSLYGSVFWKNRVRAVYHAAKGDRVGSLVTVGLYPKKFNRGQSMEPIQIGFEFVDFDDAPGPITVTASSRFTSADLDDKRPIRDRLWDYLVAPRSLGEIAARFDQSRDAARKMLSRDGRFTNNSAPGREGLWARVDHTDDID